MIVAQEDIFPNNVIALLKLRASFIDPDLTIVGRPLRNSDPAQSVGIVASQWVPSEESLEMNGRRHNEPTLQRYAGTIQAFVRDADEENGISTHAVLSKRLRAMLYRDDSLRVGLASLAVTMSGSTERMMRWGIQQQRYFSNELQGSWLYLSNLEFWFETETQ